jgi:hypothetical protein
MGSFQISEGSGKRIATEEITRNSQTQEVQLVRLSVGDDGAHDNTFGAAANFLDLESIDYDDLTTSFELLINSTEDKMQLLDIMNDTDAAIVISFDEGTTEHWYIPAYMGKSFNFISASRQCAGIVHVKYTGDAPTVGKVYASAMIV